MGFIKVDKELFLDAIDLLEEWRDGSSPTLETKDLLSRYYKTIEKKPFKSRNEYLTKKYEEAKLLVSSGITKMDACKKVGLLYDTYMRRQRMEFQGKDRSNKREY